MVLYPVVSCLPNNKDKRPKNNHKMYIFKAKLKIKLSLMSLLKLLKQQMLCTKAEMQSTFCIVAELR